MGSFVGSGADEDGLGVIVGVRVGVGGCGWWRDGRD